MAKINLKEWYFSKTVWMAVLQGILAVVLEIAKVDPELKTAGLVLILKSIIDILLRFKTDTGISY